MTKYALIPVLALLAGCPSDDSGETDTGVDTDTDTDTDTAPPLGLSAALTATGAELTITNGAAGEWFFGLAQSGTSDNWTGEDCHLGYTLESGDVLQYCHPSSNTGVTLTFGTLAEVEADETRTLFNDALPGNTAFYVEAPDGSCYVDNDTSGYYTSIGCAPFPQ